MTLWECFGLGPTVVQKNDTVDVNPSSHAVSNVDTKTYPVTSPELQTISEVPKIKVSGLSEIEGSQETSVLDLSLEELKISADGFSQESYLGEGGSGRVFKGNLYTGAEVAIKVLKSMELSDSDFLSMVHLIGGLSHENIVPLMGFCMDGNTRMLVYEFASHGSLHDVLHGWKESKTGIRHHSVLHWSQRIKIAMGVAKGLHFLHERSRVQGIKLAHRGVKSSNILLYDEYVAKLGDFNFTKETVDPAAPFDPEHDFSRQLIPEKLQEEKADVYGLGVLLLELLTGRKPVDPSAPHNQQSLVDWAMPRLTAEKVKSIVDPRLKGRYPEEGPLRLGMVAALCMDDIDFRPSMPVVTEAIQALIAMAI